MTGIGFLIIILNPSATGEWSEFWGSNFLISFVPPFLGAASLVLHQAIRVQRRTRTRLEAVEALPLRQAAAAGDDTVAPLAANQPGRIRDLEAAQVNSTWGPLKQPIDDMRDWLLVIGCVLVGLGVIALFAVFATEDAPTPPGQISVEDAKPIMLMIVAGLIISGSLLLLWAWRLSKGIRVRANEWGLRWRRLRWWGTTRASLAWEDARAFYVFTYERSSSLFSWRKTCVYVLDAPEATLVWLLPARGTAQEEALHERFSSLVLERTGLPLRDLSAAAEALAQRLPAGATNWTISKTGFGEAAGGSSSLNRLLQPQKKARPTRMIWAALAIPLLSLAVTAGGAWGLQTYQSHEYTALLVQARAHKPLYHDALTAPDGDWTVQSPTANDPLSFSFMNGSYQLTGGYPMEALAPGLFGDAAVEVTVRPLRWPQADDSQDVGLVLHSAGPYDEQQIVFSIGPAGYWFVGPASMLYDGYDHLREGGHLNPGISNRLTVLMRGNWYVCYLNGTFLGIYQADSPRTGQVGIFAEPYHDVVNFNDFTVYPL